MTRLVSLAAMALALAGCPGSIDDLGPFLAAESADASPDGALDATVDAAVDSTLDAPPDSTPTCALDVEREVLRARCASAGCHNAAEPVAGLDLESPDAGARLVAQRGRCRSLPLVVPGNPEGSLLWQKVSQARPACGSRMPVDAPLSAAELACVRQWITRASADAGRP